MLHSLNCRCVLRAVASPRCGLGCIVQEEHPIMSDHDNRKLVSSYHTSSIRTLEFQSANRAELTGSSREFMGNITSSRFLGSLAEERCSDPKWREERDRRRYCMMRRYEYTELGRKIRNRQAKLPENSIKFTVLSYNVLAQELLDQHLYLYRGIDGEVLDWDARAERLLREFRDSKADVLCLQEVQSDHYQTFYLPQLQRWGFRGVFKKRTGDKPDGCAIFYRNSKFLLRESVSIEYCKPSVQVLDRDNVGLIALLSPRNLKSVGDPPFICVATTHLLYNPRRHDVKLAQLQVLFAELDRIAFNKNTGHSDVYHPVILTGDFNLTPHSGIYEFITNGTLRYEGLSRDLLVTPSRVEGLNKELIPPHLKITDQCQHLQVVETRTRKKPDVEEGLDDSSNKSVTFSSGQLSHQLRLQSVYPHSLERLKGASEVTTFQKNWVTVDYMFYSRSEEENPSLKLLSRLGLLSGQEIESLGGLPNLATPSDHLPLISTFCWEYGTGNN